MGPTWRALVGALVLVSAGCGSDDGVTDTAAGPGDDDVAVMPIGDSITAGPYYRPHLVRTVDAADCPVDFIGTFTGAGTPEPDDADELDLDHQAVGGATSAQIEEQIGDWLDELQRPPDIALVYLGTNDFFNEIERSTTIANLESIVDALRRENPNVSILLAQIMPIIGLETSVEALDTRIAELGRRLDSTASSIEVVDMASGVEVERDLLDGVHPDDARSREMAARWADALDPLLGERCRL